MRSASRGSLAAALERLQATTGSLPAAAGSTDVAEGLFAVADLLGREVRLRRALSDPSTPEEAKTRLVDALLSSQLGPLPLEVVRDLVRARWSQPADLVEAIEALAVTSLLTVAENDGVLDDVEDELFRFGRIVDREPALRAVLTDAGAPLERRTALLRSLLGGRAQPTTVRLLERVVADPLLRSFDDALEDVVGLAATRRDRLVATVTSAVPLSAQQLERLTAALTRLYGRDVRPQVLVDPSVVGGLQVEVGDEVLDGTLARRITAARRALTA